MSEPTPCVNSNMTECMAGTRDGSSGQQSFGGRGGRGRGQGGCGGRSSSHRASGPVFKGNTEGMNSHVFQCFDELSDKTLFAMTLEALREYAAKNLDYSGDLSSLFKSLTEPTLTAPVDPPATETSKLALTVRDKKVATYCKRLDILESNLAALYAVIWGQCSKAMKAKLVSLKDYKTNCNANN